MFAYSVICEFGGKTPQKTAQEWIRWLKDEHLADVLSCGALSADIIEWDGAPLKLEVRYTFASRVAYESYVENHAPRLRADGLAKFPPDVLGLSFQRQSGEVLLSRNVKET